MLATDLLTVVMLGLTMVWMGDLLLGGPSVAVQTQPEDDREIEETSCGPY